MNRFKNNLYTFDLSSIVWVVRYGRADMKGILSSCKKKDYLLHIMFMVETSFKLATENLVKNQPDKVDKILAQSTIIFDMEEFSIRHITNKAGNFYY